MALAGYSGTPLIEKLGIKAGCRARLIDPPVDYMDLLGIDLHQNLCKAGEFPDFIHLFARSNTVFMKGMEEVIAIAKQHTNLVTWVSWYKKAAKIPTDLTEDIIRKFALQHGLVDVKVCAINDAWSGLKLVVPLAKRK